MGQWFLATSPKLCAMVPPKKNSSGLSNYDISHIGIASPSRHQCKWLEIFAGVSIPLSIECGFDGGLAWKVVQIKPNFDSTFCPSFVDLMLLVIVSP